MRRITYWAMSTLTVLVLLFSYHTSRSSTAVLATAETRVVTSSSSGSSGPSGSSGSSGASGSSAGSAGSSAGSSGSAASSGTSAASQTIAGDAVMTRYGAVQVQITVAGGRITAADVLQVPMQDRHDQMINSMAVPVYNEEVVAAQSASIDMVSGATVTYDGYVQSLQSAIDRAHL